MRLGNFILDDEGRVTVVNFEDASILPSSFCKFALATTPQKMDRDMRDMVTVPQAKDIDNTLALISLEYPILVGSGSFTAFGCRLLGDYDVEKVDVVDKVVTDEQGQPVIARAKSGLHPSIIL